MHNIILVLIVHRLLAFVAGCVEGYLDYQKDAKAKSIARLEGKPITSVIKHKKSFVWRLIIAIPVYCFITYVFTLQVGVVDYQAALYLACAFVSGAILYGMGLNLTFNQLANQKPSYLGNQAATDRKLDDRWIFFVVLSSVMLFGFELSLYIVNS